MLDHLARLLFLATLALLPWGGLVRFPWLHENAQWSDAVFAAAAAAWAAALLVARRRPGLRLLHAGLTLYLGWAALSLLAASPRAAAGPAKLLGMGMLVALAVVTSDMASRPAFTRAIGRTVTATSLLTALAAVLGAVLSAFGMATPLVGACGDLLPAPFSRAQAGFTHPNLLASYCIFAAGIAAREDAGLSVTWRRLTQAALTLTVLLTLSRAILGFALAAAVRNAGTPGRRRAVQALAAVLVFVMAGLTVYNLTLNPARPWDVRSLPGTSPRLEAAATSIDTLATHPLLGTGPGTSPGRRGSLPFDAHFTPLNVAATLGLPALAGLALVPVALWRSRARPTDRATWGMLAGLGVDALGQDVEDFRHVWVAFGLADAGRTGVSRGERPGGDGR